jgi:hypothetical protein
MTDINIAQLHSVRKMKRFAKVTIAWVAFIVCALIWLAFRGQVEGSVLAVSGLALVLSGFIVYAAQLLSIHGKIVIANGQVKYSKTSLFRKTEWLEPLSAYAGLKLTTSRVYMGIVHEDVHSIELAHPVPKKQVGLYESISITDAETKLKEFSTEFDLHKEKKANNG